MDADALGGSAADASADVPLARFELRVDNVRHLFGLLSAIYNGRKDSFALIKVNHKGEWPGGPGCGGGRQAALTRGAHSRGEACRHACPRCDASRFGASAPHANSRFPPAPYPAPPPTHRRPARERGKRIQVHVRHVAAQDGPVHAV